MGEIKKVTHSGQLKTNIKTIIWSSFLVSFTLSIFVFMPMINVWSTTNRSKKIRNKSMNEIKKCELYLIEGKDIPPKIRSK